MPARGSVATVTIASQGMRDPIFATMGGIRCSWVVSSMGSLTGEMAWEDYWAAGGENIRGKWLIYEHPTCGTWGGVVTDIDTTDSGGIGITAYDFSWTLLQKRRTARTYKQQQNAPGGLALRAITDAQAECSVRFADIQADEGGTIQAAEWRGDTVLDVLNRLVSDSSQEWIVSTDSAGNSTFRWKQKMGTDRTATILLREGIEIISPRVTSSIYDLVNDIVGVPGDRDWEQSKAQYLIDQTSIDTYGRLQGGAIPYERLVYGSAMATVMRAELKRRAYPVTTGSVTVADNLPALTSIRDGDTILIHVHMLRKPFAIRVMARSADIDNGTVELAGDAA